MEMGVAFVVVPFSGWCVHDTRNEKRPIDIVNWKPLPCGCTSNGLTLSCAFARSRAKLSAREAGKLLTRAADKFIRVSTIAALVRRSSALSVSVEISRITRALLVS